MQNRDFLLPKRYYLEWVVDDEVEFAQLEDKGGFDQLEERLELSQKQVCLLLITYFLTSERSEEVPFFDEVFGPVAYTVTAIRRFLRAKLFEFLE